jgi:drug/metabolite transporter (DMT)-like permease
LSFAFLLLAALFVLTIANALSLKVCSSRLDHRVTPVFIAFWSLAGLAVVWPLMGHSLWAPGFAVLFAKPWLLFLAIVKGGILHGRFVRGQALTRASLSSSFYVRPMSVGLIACVNFLLGERLTPAQWIAALGLCLLSTAFFFKGHLSEFTQREKRHYIDLVAFSVAMAAIDYTVLRAANWYVLLFVTNVAMLALCFDRNRREPEVLKAAFTRPAVAAGMIFSLTEMVKFYQQVTLSPISLVLVAQSITQPVIMALSALIWKERTIREQILWGFGAFFLVILPFLAEFVTRR